MVFFLKALFGIDPKPIQTQFRIMERDGFYKVQILKTGRGWEDYTLPMDSLDLAKDMFALGNSVYKPMPPEKPWAVFQENK